MSERLILFRGAKRLEYHFTRDAKGGNEPQTHFVCRKQITVWADRLVLRTLKACTTVDCNFFWMRGLLLHWMNRGRSPVFCCTLTISLLHPLYVERRSCGLRKCDTLHDPSIWRVGRLGASCSILLWRSVGAKIGSGGVASARSSGSISRTRLVASSSIFITSIWLRIFHRSCLATIALSRLQNFFECCLVDL